MPWQIKSTLTELTITNIIPSTLENLINKQS